MRLTTSRLTIREIEVSDIDALSAYQSDARYLKSYSAPPNAKDIVKLAGKWAAETPRINYQFVICAKASPRAIGCAGIRCEDYPAQQGEMGVELNPEYWGQGLALEAVDELLSFALILGLVEVHAVTMKQNRRAQKLLRSAGFQESEQRIGRTRNGLVFTVSLSNKLD